MGHHDFLSYSDILNRENIVHMVFNVNRYITVFFFVFFFHFSHGNNFCGFLFVSLNNATLPNKVYRIYSAIRWGFHLSKMTTNNLISSM